MDLDLALRDAKELKRAGNAFFLLQQHDEALEAYDAAIKLVEGSTRFGLGSPAVMKQANQELARWYLNRAATHLLPGNGFSPKKAIEYGKKDEELDAKYTKSYVRQARAHESLGQHDLALDAVVRGMQQNENDHALVQLFIDLLTEGFSEDESTFKTFVLDILINDKKSSARLKGLKGARARRIDAHLAKWN
ncbi:hypothetical protein C8J56DRAFT_875811 [Mycena floridula]|nr:hypothetical protein C8J56DRAFT_875811 [Mycena floridula]